MKLFISPFVWYLLAVLTGLLVLRRSTDCSRTRIANGLVLLTLLTTLASTSPVGILLERSLRVDRATVAGSTPEFIFVLSGGYSRGSTPSEDVLGTEGAARVRHAVNEWRSNRGSRLVFSGTTPETSRGRDRDGELMARAAASYGVPDSVLILEPRSKNTREHPIEALRIPGVMPTTHVAVVTSDYHMRRARREFCRYFEVIDSYPVPPSGGVTSLRDLVPQAERLSVNTVLLREWFGIVWYAIRGIGVEGVDDC